MAQSFLILPELQEMLNKLDLFSKTPGTNYERDIYTDLKSSLKILIAIEKGKEDE